MKKFLVAGLATAVLGFAGSAQAAVVFFSTFNGLQPYKTWSVVQFADGWTNSVGPGMTAAGPGIELQNHVAGNPNTSSDKDVFVELDSHNGKKGLNNSSMSRTVAQGGSFVLDFLYSPRPGVAAESNGIAVFVNNVQVPPTFAEYSKKGTLWSLKTLKFSAPQNFTLTFSAVGTSETLGGYVDDIKLTAVPEPATWAMMIMGFAGLGAVLRRRRSLAVA